MSLLLLRPVAGTAPAVGSGDPPSGDEVVAASASLAHVQAAVDLAEDGDTVLIPNGTATWTDGIDTSKQIIIRAQNYTPTPAGTEGAGATSRNVTLTNNSSNPLFAFVTGDSFHCGVGGIDFQEGTGTGAHIVFTGDGTKVPFIFDCYLENRSRLFPDDQIIVVACRGGVMWNCYMKGTQDIHTVGEGSLLVKLPNGIRNWTTASTMGTADDGTWNFYVEDSTFKDVGACPDIDDHGRFVCRHVIYDGTWGATHGFTSLFGGRHWEYYDCHFKSLTPERNIANRYFWCRAGTGIFTDNIVDEDFEPSDYGGTPQQLQIGDNTSPSSYPMDRQPGGGHNGSAYVIDPIYIWNCTGDFPYDWGFQDDPGDWSTIVQEDRDIFVNNGAKPGYSKFTYPHPLRGEVE